MRHIQTHRKLQVPEMDYLRRLELPEKNYNETLIVQEETKNLLFYLVFYLAFISFILFVTSVMPAGVARCKPGTIYSLM